MKKNEATADERLVTKFDREMISKALETGHARVTWDEDGDRAVVELVGRYRVERKQERQLQKGRV